MSQITWEGLVLMCILGLLVLIGIGVLLRKRLLAWMQKNNRNQARDVLEFQRASQKQKTQGESKSSGRDVNIAPKAQLKPVDEQNHSFMTINKEITERDKTGLLNYTIDNSLKLDTITHTEEDDPTKINLDLEKELSGMYLNTSAQNSTKNSNKKEMLFIDYRGKKQDSTKDKEMPEPEAPEESPQDVTYEEEQDEEPSPEQDNKQE